VKLGLPKMAISNLRKTSKFEVTESNIGLVLSGGGARGAYQIGVMNAMAECKLMEKVTHVYGTSVGAINAAVIAQGDLEIASRLWKQLDYSKIFKEGEEVAQSAEYDPKAIYKVGMKMVKEKSLSIEPLYELLKENINEDAIRKSKIHFGLVTFDITDFKKRYLTIEQIPKGELIDYIIASASLYPFFPIQDIDGHKYLDGGIADNRPLQFLAEEVQVKQAIVIDLTTMRHFWLKKRIREDLKVDYILPSSLLGSPLAFNLDRINRNLKLGYEDFKDQVNLVSK